MGPLFLLVDDDERLLRSVRRQLGKPRVVTAHTVPEATLWMSTWMWWNGMAFDLHLARGDVTGGEAPNGIGIGLVALARERHPDLPLTIYSGYDVASLRKQAAAHDVEYLVKSSDDVRLYNFYHRCALRADDLPPLPRVTTSRTQIRQALVHWTARTIVRLELSVPLGQVLFVEAEALAKRGRLLTRREEADALGIKEKAARSRRTKILERAQLHSLEELFERICAHAGLEHCFTDSPDRMRRISGTIPKAAHACDPIAPRRASGDDEDE